ncbi:hypothetical protein KBY76_01660 [Synechococcus sp. GreenBA-s]|nr:hypothetical protein [Synechococcus sp. GreenBA-s]
MDLTAVLQQLRGMRPKGAAEKIRKASSMRVRVIPADADLEHWLDRHRRGLDVWPISVALDDELGVLIVLSERRCLRLADSRRPQVGISRSHHAEM